MKSWIILLLKKKAQRKTSLGHSTAFRQILFICLFIFGCCIIFTFFYTLYVATYIEGKVQIHLQEKFFLKNVFIRVIRKLRFYKIQRFMKIYIFFELIKIIKKIWWWIYMYFLVLMGHFKIQGYNISISI